MSWALLTSSATLGLASKVWGSVLGLFKIDETLTYFPPIWASTLAYWFSAPMALINAVVLRPAAAGRAATARTRRAATERPPPSTASGRARVRRRSQETDHRMTLMYIETESHYN